MEIKDHFGVYGVCLQDGKLLCIEKTRGPYRHRFDLPGGSQEPGEGLTDTLKREVLDGSNDSANAIWLNLEEITADNASPLVLKVKAELRGFPELELTSYNNWKVKEIKEKK